MDELDALIDEAVVYGELSAGAPPQWLANQYDARLVTVTASQAYNPTRRRPRWTATEKQFIINNIGWMTDREIAQALGRSAEAVKIYRKRILKLTPRSADPDWPTAREVSRMLGLPCSKKVTRWIELGLLPARTAALEAHMWTIPRRALIRFVADPDNWCYFQPERVRDPGLRKIIRWRRERWHDEWWTIGQVAAYHGVTISAINATIHRGRLPARKWGNWWVKRSDAVALRIAPGKGSGQGIDWSSAGDAWLILGRALGLSYSQIAMRNGWPWQRVRFRFDVLRRENLIPRLIRRHGLAVAYDTDRRIVFADWRNYRTRVPRLATAMDRFMAGTARSSDVPYIQATLRVWAQWHAQTKEQQRLAAALQQIFVESPATLYHYAAKLAKWEIVFAERS